MASFIGAQWGEEALDPMAASVGIVVLFGSFQGERGEMSADWEQSSLLALI